MVAMLLMRFCGCSRYLILASWCCFGLLCPSSGSLLKQLDKEWLIQEPGINIMQETTVDVASVDPMDIWRDEEDALLMLGDAIAGKGSTKKQDGCSLSASHFKGRKPEDVDLFVSYDDYNATTNWLTSYPCSGNTWTRVMIELATSIRTGSRYNDKRLKTVGLLGEGEDDPSKVIVVKTHYPGLGHKNDKQIVDFSWKTELGRAIVIVRHPLHAVLSFAEFKVSGSHTEEVAQKELRKYLDTHLIEYLTLWRKHSLYWTSLPTDAQILFLRYEDMIAHTESMLLNRLLPFIGINTAMPAIEANVKCMMQDAADLASIQREHSYVFDFTDHDMHVADHLVGGLAKTFGYNCFKPHL